MDVVLGGPMLIVEDEAPEEASFPVVATDQKATQQRLAALNKKLEEARKILQEAVAINKISEGRWNDIRSKEKEIDDKLGVVAAREKRFEDREAALVKRLDHVIERENAADAKLKELKQ